MKRMIFAIGIFFLVVTGVFSEGVEDINGFDWWVFSEDAKVGYVQGFYSAYSSVWERFYSELGETATPEDEKRLEELFYIPLSVGEMIDRVDSFYSDYDNRDLLLYMVLMYISGKDYWNSGSLQEEEDTFGEDPSKRS